MVTHEIFFEQEGIFLVARHPIFCGICHNFILQVLLSVEMKANFKCMDYLGSKIFSIYISNNPYS